LSVRRNFIKLGADLSAARRRRRIPTQLMAERAFISRPTLARVERGDPSVSMGIYATILFVLGMNDRIGKLAEPSSDEIALSIELERLPLRIRKGAARRLLTGRR
jgi:transcriptional regulator with XRE-family HTH domain